MFNSFQRLEIFAMTGSLHVDAEKIQSNTKTLQLQIIVFSHVLVLPELLPEAEEGPILSLR